MKRTDHSLKLSPDNDQQVPPPHLTFTQKLALIDQSLQIIEEGKLDVTTLLAHYQSTQTLINECEAEIKSASQKITIIENGESLIKN